MDLLEYLLKINSPVYFQDLQGYSLYGNTGKHLIFLFSFPINELVNFHTPVVTMFFCMIINSRTKVIIFIDTQIIQPLTHGSLFKLPRGSF